MRLLDGHSRYMIRLGWLRLVARVVGAGQMNRGALATKLAELATPNLENWLDEAGLIAKPRGAFSKDAIGRLPGVAERLGIYAAESEQLTDLGRVLFLVDRAYKEIDSPFAWPTPLRYVGLRILLGADGDLLLEILRAWPHEGRLTHPLKVIAGAASRLRDRTDDAAQAGELHRLAMLRAPKPKTTPHWESTYPILEPLRELGYATRAESGGEGGQYSLTPRGDTLAAAVREGLWAGRSADAILEESFGRLFSAAEGRTPMMEASLEPIRETLVDLPDMLLGGLLSEAPLEPVVLLTEARLLSTGAATCIELASSRTLLHELGRRTGGQVALKQGRMAWEANIAWTSPDCLRDPALFRVELPPADRRLPATEKLSSDVNVSVELADGPPGAGAGPSAPLQSIAGAAPSQVDIASPAAPTAPAGGEPAVEPIATREHLVHLLRMRLPDIAAAPVTVEPPIERIAAEPPAEPVATARITEAKALEPIAAQPPAVPAPAPVRVVLWLQYVGRLVEEPTLGAPDSLSAGAPSSWIERLRSLAAKPKFLPRKRQPDPLPWPAGAVKLHAAGSPPAVYLPARWCEQLEDLPPVRPLASAVHAWSDEDTGVRLLRVALDRAKDACEGVAAREVRERIERFLDGEAKDDTAEEKAWDEARLLTTAWLEDLIDRNLAPRADLKHKLHREAQEGLTRKVAAALFATEGESRRMTVTRTFRVPSVMVSRVLDSPGRAIEVGSSPALAATVETVSDVDDAGHASVRRNALRVTVEVDASSRALALARASERAWDALKKVRFLAGVCEMAASLDDQGIATDGAPDVIADGEDVPGTEPLASIARLSLAPNFPRAAALPAEHLREADHPRLSRTLHWLAAADQGGLSPAHRLSNVWVAMEHLIVEQDEEHGPAVARTLADVGALCRVEALAGYVTRELCEALRHARRHRGALPEVALELRIWEAPIREHLGQEALDVIDDRRKEPASFTDAAALSLLLSREITDLNSLRRQFAEDTPIAAFAIRHFSRNILGKPSDFAAWLRSTRREIQSLVLHAYEIRNLLFHDGVAFGFEDAARLHNLYARFRLVVDAVVARFAAALVRAAPDIAPGEQWARLRIGVRELLYSADQDKSGASVDREALRRAVFLTAG